MEISIPISQQHGGWMIGAGDLRSCFPVARKSSTVRFADRGHEQYYNCITNKMKEKEKAKKLKTKEKENKKSCVNGLSKKQKLELLKTFSESFTAVSDSENPVLGYQIQTDELTEAAETFLKKLKEMRMNEDSSSSSSSSSSSESDCDLRSVVPQQKSREAETTTSIPAVSVSRSSKSAAATVEVCMGGKCKKSGGEALMAELKRQTEEIQIQSQTQTQVTVMACKCMGKCISAPNVRVSSASNNESIDFKSNPLMIGLALDHVPSILHSLFPQPPPIMS